VVPRPKASLPNHRRRKSKIQNPKSERGSNTEGRLVVFVELPKVRVGYAFRNSGYQISDFEFSLVIGQAQIYKVGYPLTGRVARKSEDRG
jgi:hypothetical protein